jgi:hypothetical protein
MRTASEYVGKKKLHQLERLRVLDEQVMCAHVMMCCHRVCDVRQ